MKLAEFLESLEATKSAGWLWKLEDGQYGEFPIRGHGWHGSREERLLKTRGPDGQYCPITAVLRHNTGIWCSVSDFLRAAKRLGLSTHTANRIAHAADNELGQWHLRQRLIRAVGIEPSTEK